MFEERYPNSTFAQQATDIKLKSEQAKIFSKGQSTRVKKKDMDALQDVADKWKNAGHQDNFSRAAILRAFDKSTPVLRLFVTSALKCKTQQRNLGVTLFLCAFQILPMLHSIFFHLEYPRTTSPQGFFVELYTSSRM